MPVVTDRAVAAGRYELRQQLAVSASASVWRAFDQRLGRDVCLKLLHPQLRGSRSARRRIMAEASAAARLEHPNIVAPLDTHFDRESAAIVFPLVEGETLAARLDAERLSPHEAAHICAEVADALAYAHAHGVVHRDVTPGNIMLGADGRVFLLDFGIAASREQAALQLTEAGTTLGTLPYMAPEQLGGAEARPANDIWSLGAVLYEALAGERAYEAATPVALAAAHRSRPRVIADAPPGLAALAMLALDLDPATRPTAEVMAASLRGWQASLPDAATTVVPINATAVLPIAPAPGASRWQARRRGVLTAVAAVGLASAIVVAFSFAPGEQAGQSLPPPDGWSNRALLPSPTASPTASPVATPTPRVVVVKAKPKPKPKPNPKHHTKKHRHHH